MRRLTLHLFVVTISPKMQRISFHNHHIRKEILVRDGNLSLDQVTEDDDRSNKQYLYKPKNFYT